MMSPIAIDLFVNHGTSIARLKNLESINADPFS